MSGLTTHVLDTARGIPAAAVPVQLEQQDEQGEWATVSTAVTEADGRARLADSLDAATYRLTFATGEYLGTQAFFPRVRVEFTVEDPGRHHHVPLLLSPYGYSTYRGS